MRSLSIIFLFVVVGFVIYTSLITEATQGTSVDFFQLNGSEAISKGERYNYTLPSPLEKLSNSSLVSSVGGFFERASSLTVSREELYSAIEFAVRLSLVVVLLAMSLYLLTSLVVR